MVVAMMGLEALGARLDETTAFRVEQVRSITGIEPGGIMTPSALAEVFLHPAGLFKGTFERARKVVFLNKGDLMEEDTKAQELADMLLVEPRSRIESVILGSLKKRMYRIRRMKDVR
jgi:probable selenium-dependent hydroxylase accessory protein YqeC